MSSEDDAQESPETLAMLKVINILRPLRQHRQASAERRQRAVQVQLEQAQQRFASAREELVAEREQERTKREELSSEHCNQAISMREVNDWQSREQGLITHVSNLDHGVAQLQIQLEQLDAELEAARLDAKARQRAVEKLGCLTEAMEQAR